jgi:hypothetical protein
MVFRDVIIRRCCQEFIFGTHTPSVFKLGAEHTAHLFGTPIRRTRNKATLSDWKPIIAIGTEFAKIFPIYGLVAVGAVVVLVVLLLVLLVRWIFF